MEQYRLRTAGDLVQRKYFPGRLIKNGPFSMPRPKNISYYLPAKDNVLSVRYVKCFKHSPFLIHELCLCQ